MPIDTEIRQLGMKDLQEADEVFICNSLIGIWPVIAVDDRKYTEGNNDLTLQDLLASATEPG